MNNGNKFLLLLIVAIGILMSVTFSLVQADGVEAARVPYIAGRAVPIELTEQECAAGVVWVYVDLGEL